jgi:hypothetical protein
MRYRLAAVALAGALAASGCGTDTADLEAEIARLEAELATARADLAAAEAERDGWSVYDLSEYEAAFESGDVERVAALFTDDGILATAGDLLAGADLDSLRVGSEEFRSLAMRHRGADMKVLGTPIMVEKYGFQTAVFAGQWGDAIKFTVMLHLQDGKIALHIIDLAGPLEIPES